ncbi:MAG: hypothetical protein WCS20_01890 [Alphaproteobacteria bacterium]
MTFIAALRHDGITAPWVIDGPFNGGIMHTYVALVLTATLNGASVNRVVITRNGASFTPEHPSKAHDLALKPGDSVLGSMQVDGGQGDCGRRDPAMIAEAVRFGRDIAARARL